MPNYRALRQVAAGILQLTPRGYYILPNFNVEILYKIRIFGRLYRKNRHKRRVHFLPYKPGAPHPVASAPFKALTCFGLFGLWSKIEAPRHKRRGLQGSEPAKIIN
jgi:hypothetical protein